MKLKHICLIVVIAGTLLGCKKPDDGSASIPPVPPVNQVTPSYLNVSISVDKAIYKPGDEVTFISDNSLFPVTAKVRYKHLNAILSEAAIAGSTWKWTTPSTDFTGYIAEIYSNDNGTETIYSTIGIDVSSSWKKFPRYGFLSKFPLLNDDEIDAVINNLNRYHINGFQFYDWHNKHHKPLPLTGSGPATTWKNISNTDVYFNTVQKYISSAHSRNMKAMFYNLVYGAWENADVDGVQKEWYIYKDNTHTTKEFLRLSAPFLSNIYLLDPSNTEWQKYIENENKKVYQYLDFDGFHMDQLGDWGGHYTYDGAYLNLSETYETFINAIKEDEPEKDIVMNAVAQYGQQGIAEASSDFLYTEVWSPYDSYNDLANLIKQNNVYSNNNKNTVLAAYVNYDMAYNKGYFNTPSVLLANAVIFAFGGAHLELGEHMLGQEYFPNDNLSMKDDLKKALPSYYDFLVAYQNLLRDGGVFNDVSISSIDGKISLAKWPASQGHVACFGKKVGNSQVIHLINFKDSKTTNWRDNTGIQVAPALIKDAQLVFTSDAAVKKMWVASPDIIGAGSRSVNFAQNGNKVSFILPELKYWSMIVVEY
jgi:dextranase